MKDHWIVKLLFSTRTMTFLLFAFALSMAVGTWIEHIYDTPTSKKWIYNAWWFSAMMFLLVLNFIGNIKRYQLLQWKKWATLTLHLSWILIIIGAGITRYISFEGMMLIREGSTEQAFYSDETYMSVIMQGMSPDGQEMQREIKDKMLITPYDYSYSLNEEFYDKDISITIDTLIFDAVEGLIPSEDGKERYLKIVEAGQGTRHDHLLKDGEKALIHNTLFGVNLDPELAAAEDIVNIVENWNGYTIQTPFEGQFMRMADQMQGEVFKDSIQTLNLRSLYTIGNMQFVIPEPITAGNVGIIKSPEPTAAKAYGIKATVTSGTDSKKIEMLGGKGIVSDYVDVEVNGVNLYIKYGSIMRELPFSITLEDFIADKHPGTEKAYAAFESKVLVNDDNGSTAERIYMNNVLDKDGYRFFQAGFDPDELGTHLSVNHDFWGKTVTYAGYYLLYIGLLALLFDPNTRFGELGRLIRRVNKRKAKMNVTAVFILLMSSLTFAQDGHEGHDHAPGEHQEVTATSTKLRETPVSRLDSIIVANMIPQEQADKFGEVIIQDNGRMKPISTLASELLRKISERDYYEATVGDSIVRLSPEQTLLSMMQFGNLWYEVPLIRLKRGNDSIRDILGIDRSRKYAAGMDFFRSPDGEFIAFKLAPYLDEANQSDRKNAFQKDFIDVNSNLGLLDQVVSSSMIRIFPKPNDPINKWYSYPELNDAGFKSTDSVLTKQFIPAYLQTLRYGKAKGDYSEADQVLASLNRFQKAYGGEVMPSESKIKAEILYNKYDVFRNLYMWYAWFGVFLILLLISEILMKKPLKELRYAIQFHKVVIIGLFIVHMAGLITRWYISGHAPWSDAYESLLYVAWAIMLFGLLLGRKSELTMAAAAFVVAIVLWVAHLNWLDPDVANIQPVLDSYWLMIHVAVIVASYGPFALGMILGIITFILMIFSNDKNKKRMDLNIKQLTYINEAALTIGLIMLTIGNFLGGMWANESWGRYWGWDPKETWALISIFVYAIVLHLRLVPGLKSRWTFNLWSILSFLSILMTYFGVNFYLSGLHSYASGDQVLSLQYVAFFVLFVAAIGIPAYIKERKIFKKKDREQ
ncbi:cytochrome C biogenesis protein [Nonlabens arenilitoris]|uniref:Cytochrome C biogenesis protein n=1 Tax=Nonlabens arenilitoris TaxID=1217969 RepID=A0A2S7UD98_9FLAO|nr:cytochrome c biogenesis protein CcsA [Nonlabens arenilitoris]PQJ32915.1 cytochrome C biogenesis protein [Nonlabens arenilitoris]